MAAAIRATKAAKASTTSPVKRPAGKAKKPLKPVLNSSPGHLLRRAEQRAMNIYMQEVGGKGLTPRQFVVLTAVAEYEGVSQTDLVEVTGIDRSTLADMVARMIANGHLSRKRTKDDQRVNAVKITAAGKRILKSTEAKVAAAEKRTIAPLPAAKRKVFQECLRLLAEREAEPTPTPAKKPAAARAKKPRR